jgi:hypothetical protein
MTIELTEKQREGLVSAVWRGLDDCSHYLEQGSPDIDHGDDWPYVAREEAEHWIECGEVMLQAGEKALADQCSDLAFDLCKSAYEYEQEHSSLRS